MSGPMPQFESRQCAERNAQCRRCGWSAPKWTLVHEVCESCRYRELRRKVRE